MRALRLATAVTLTASIASIVSICATPHPATAEDKAVRALEPSGAAASGARVIVLGWPQESAGHLDTSSKVATRVLSQTVARADGTYTLPRVSLATLQAIASPDGTVNTETLVLGPDYEGMTSKPLKVQPPVRGTSAAARTTAAVALPQVPVHTFPARTSSTRPAAAAVSPADDAVTCGTTRLKDFPKTLTVVGSIWSTSDNVRQAFAYSDGASSSLGVGVSGSGDYGSYSTQGTHSVSTSYTEGFPSHLGQVRIHERTWIVPAKYRTTCNQQIPHRSWSTYFTQARYVAGGTSESRLSKRWLPRVNGQDCVHEVKGSFEVMNHTTAETHTAGFETKTLIGVNLSARSGWTHQVSLRASWVRGGGWLCGTRSVPNQSDLSHGEIVARAHKPA